MRNVLSIDEPATLAAAMLRRTELLLRMRKHHLDIDWVKEFSLSQLDECCGRMISVPGDDLVAMQALQKELIQNPAFADYYAALIPLFPEAPAAKSEPAPYPSRYARSWSPPRVSMPQSRRAILLERLCSLLENCWDESRDITAFPISSLMETLELDDLSSRCQLTYLCNFSPLHLSAEEQETIAENLSCCCAVPSVLSDVQKELLFEPFVGACQLFSTTDFVEVCTLLESCPELLDIARLLYAMQLHNDLQLEHYRRFAADPFEYRRLMEVIFAQMETQTANSFLKFWQKNGCPLRELQIMAQRITADMDLATMFSNYPGYINLLYGRRFHQIDLSDVNSYQEDVLIYAIVHQKKHFIRLVDEHAQEFLALPMRSPLFVRELYAEHFNLNELTEKDLGACAWMSAGRLKIAMLTPGRLYTFPELRTLYDVPNSYVTIYNLLTWDRQDDRLKVIKQLLKRNVLRPDMTEQELVRLSEQLNKKPLYDWMQEDFGHISGLQPADAVQLLLHLDPLRHLLPSIHNRTDALLTLRQGEQLAQFATLEALKENIIQVDAEWLALSEAMGLGEPFCAQYQDSILQFLCQNGAHIANVYRRDLSAPQEQAFLRVVKAELMGQLLELKYYEGDLQKELDFPLTECVKAHWKENTALSRGEMVVQEHDDFFSTMLLGVQPQRTCLSYEGGLYKHCLLAGFDSNKKVLYATRNGAIVGRAYLRLTKGRLTRAGQTEESDSRFTFVDLENVDATRRGNTQSDECLTLFLECPYISGLNPTNEQQVKEMFTELVTRKANMLRSALVLSHDYQGAHTDGFAWTQFDIYISKTKAGAQYLDSLNGQATVSVEGSYKSNSFLVLKST